jgi:hypothetical protein
VTGRDRLVLEPIAGAAQVGRLLAALEDGRRRTLRELETVDDALLGRRPAAMPLRSIGQVLYHVALIEADSVPPYDVTAACAIHHLVQHEAHRAHPRSPGSVLSASAAKRREPAPVG